MVFIVHLRIQCIDKYSAEMVVYIIYLTQEHYSQKIVYAFLRLPVMKATVPGEHHKL